MKTNKLFKKIGKRLSILYNQNRYAKGLILTSLIIVICLASVKIIKEGMMQEVAIVKDIVNILFFLTVGTIGILSYLQAKKTIFTPLKTEIIKYQLKAI
jgi:hypothetical protein